MEIVEGCGGLGSRGGLVEGLEAIQGRVTVAIAPKSQHRHAYYYDIRRRLGSASRRGVDREGATQQGPSQKGGLAAPAPLGRLLAC